MSAVLPSYHRHFALQYLLRGIVFLRRRFCCGNQSAGGGSGGCAAVLTAPHLPRPSAIFSITSAYRKGKIWRGRNAFVLKIVFVVLKYGLSQERFGTYLWEFQ